MQGNFLRRQGLAQEAANAVALVPQWFFMDNVREKDDSVIGQMYGRFLHDPLAQNLLLSNCPPKRCLHLRSDIALIACSGIDAFLGCRHRIESDSLI